MTSSGGPLRLAALGVGSDYVSNGYSIVEDLPQLLQLSGDQIRRLTFRATLRLLWFLAICKTRMICVGQTHRNTQPTRWQSVGCKLASRASRIASRLSEPSPDNAWPPVLVRPLPSTASPSPIHNVREHHEVGPSCCPWCHAHSQSASPAGRRAPVPPPDQAGPRQSQSSSTHPPAGPQPGPRASCG